MDEDVYILISYIVCKGHGIVYWVSQGHTNPEPLYVQVGKEGQGIGRVTTSCVGVSDEGTRRHVHDSYVAQRIFT